MPSRDLKELINSVLSREKKLEAMEGSEHSHIRELAEKHGNNSHVTDEELARAVKTLESEIEKAVEIEKNIEKLEQQELEHERKIIDEPDTEAQRKINQLEDEEKTTREAVKDFFSYVRELENQTRELISIARESQSSQEILEELEELDEKVSSIESSKKNIREGLKDVDLGRRKLLKAAGAAAAGAATWKLSNSKKYDPSHREAEVAEFLEEFHREVSGYSGSSVDYSEPNLLLGELHSYSPAFKMMPEMIERHGTTGLGLEFIYRDDEVVDKFNAGRIGPEEMAAHYNKVSGFGRKQKNLVKTFRALKQNNGKLYGLEFSKAASGYPESDVTRADAFEKIPDGRSFFAHRSRIHAGIASKIASKHSRTMIQIGFSHIDLNAPVPYYLMKSSRPKYSTKLDPGDVVENPYAYIDVEEDFDGPRDFRIFVEEPEHLIASNLDSSQTVLSTARDQLTSIYLYSNVREYSSLIDGSELLSDRYSALRNTLENLKPGEYDSRYGMKVKIV